MPGLIGIVWNSKMDEPLLDRMVGSIKHAEWQRVEKYSNSFFSAARVSLGIFNPEPQPIFNEDKTLCIFMYGKVYDYGDKLAELKRRGHQFNIGNDAEFCLHSFEEYGRAFVKELNGSFVLVIYDLKQKKIIIANDRYGFRPLYHAMSGGKLLFASEVKAILEDNAFKKELNDRTIADFFAFGEIQGNKTFFNGIDTLSPASVLIYDGKNVLMERYWDFHYHPDYSLSENDIVEQLIQTMKKAVRIRMIDNLRYGLFLSGGLDSRALLAAIDKSERRRVTALTFGVPGCDEIKVAKIVAQKAGINHLVKELDVDDLVSHADEVVYLSDGMDTIAVSHLPDSIARTDGKIDVTFNGLGLDVMLGGSFLDHSICGAESDEELVKIWYRKLVVFSPEMMGRLFVLGYYNKIKDMPLSSLSEALHNATDEHPMNKSDHFVVQNHTRRFTILGSVIWRNKQEEATPCLDNGFIEVIQKIPPELRADHRIFRKFLIKLASELAAIPYQRTMVRVDAPLIVWKVAEDYQGVKNRIRKEIRRLTGGRIRLPNKRSYINLDEWLRLNENWRSFVKGILLDEEACSRYYFNRDYIETLIKEHEVGNIDHSGRLTYLVTFELFLRQFASG